jgi:ParB family chromosome partitioning protein
MASSKGLGRGLDALLGGDSADVTVGDALRTLNVAKLQPGKYQPRTHMDQVSLAQLAESIKAQGIMQPILVRPIASEKYEIIAGERRWRAGQLAGLSEVPVLVREIADEAALAMALIENIQREDLNPLEEANGIQRLIDEFAMTHQTAADAVGRSRSAVTNLLRLQSLPAKVQDMLMQNRLDMGHARALLGLSGAKQLAAAEQIVQQGLSVRAAENLVKHMDAKTKPRAQKASLNRDILALQNTLSEQLGANVSIAAKASGAGTLKINYSTLDQLDEIINKISR